ncbi:MAG: tetratricopeptide repeat protein [Gemmatimonadetes bacterium]|nr:tetratricopeptide repeat protein [Gemmatimonadota bacterium]
MPLRDRDTADDIQRLQTLAWSGVGLILGMLLGALLSDKFGWPLLPSMVGAAVVLAGGIYAITRLITVGAGRAAGTIHNPSGSSTPYAHSYSLAESMVAQGDYRNAATLYRDYINADPTDGEACLRLARLLRDHLRRYDEAARWFRAARQCKQSSRGELLITRELIEMALAQQHDPPRATPELARLAQRFPGTPEARWAREELADIRKRIAEP